MNVQSILKSKNGPVHSVRPEQTLADAADLLADHRIGVVLVTDGDDVVGVLSERDIVAAVSKRRASALTLPVRSVMSSPVLTCRPQDSIKEVMQVMNTRRIRHLPVVDDDTVVGMISIRDVIKHRLDEKQMEVAVLRDVAMAIR